MLLHYSPHFNGHTYINYPAHTEHNGGLMGETVESTEGLLSRLELMSGMAYPDESDSFKDQRALEYCKILQANIPPTNLLYNSIANDSTDLKSENQDEYIEGDIEIPADSKADIEATSATKNADLENADLEDADFGSSPKSSNHRTNVSAELLRWRDTLILAGWNKRDPLPGKLQVISIAEKCIPSGSIILRGTADRWHDLKDRWTHLTSTANSSPLTPHSSPHITIQVHQPKSLVEPLIQAVISIVDPHATYTLAGLTDATLNPCTVLKFNELYQAYEWLTQQPVQPGQVIVCNDGQRLDDILRCHALPTTSDAATQGCHHVITDVRSTLDTPDSLIWLDCNGDYGFQYPYTFISESERSALSALSITYPDEQTMLTAIHRHIIHQLNQVHSVTLISSAYDTASLLPQHPMVASALFRGGKETKVPVSTPNLPLSPAIQKQINITPQPCYDIHQDVRVSDDVKISYSSLEQLIQYPFTFVTERELGLYEPYNEQDAFTEKGNVAHRVVRFLFHQHKTTDLDITDADYQHYFSLACTHDDDMKPQRSILLDAENKFVLEDLKFTLRESIKALSRIIQGNNLAIIDSEAEIPLGAKANKTSVDLHPFGASKAYIDLILQHKETGQYYIFDFKYSMSTSHPDKLGQNKSIQFAFYQQIFEQYYQGGGKTLTGIGYYLFPLHTLYVPTSALSGGITGANVTPVPVDTASAVANTFGSMARSYADRMDHQLAHGIIEEGENQPEQDIDKDLLDAIQAHEPLYTKDPLLFPRNLNSGKKKPPYSPSHLALKNQLR